MQTSPLSMPPEGSQPAGPGFRLTDPVFLAGLAMFFCNRFSDMFFNVPVLELALPFVMLAFVIRDNTLSRLGRVPGSLLMLAFLFWITLSNFHNGISISGQMRYTIVLITLVMPVLCFMLLKNRQPLMVFILGVILGSGLYFVGLAAWEFSHGGISRALRGDQPTPVVPLAFLSLFYKQLSKPLKFFILLVVVLSFGVALAIEARGAVLSLAIAAAIFAAARLSPLPRLTVPAMVILGMVAHFASSMFVSSSFDAVALTSQDSVSNLERAYAIDYSRMMLDHYPWFGSSPKSYAVNFTDYFNAIAGFSEQGDQILSPHNTFLEYSVFFGYPAGILFVLMLARMVYVGMVSKALARSLAVALAAAGIIRLGALYGFSGTLRMEWFALMFILLYAYQSKSQPDPALATAPLKPRNQPAQPPRKLRHP